MDIYKIRVVVNGEEIVYEFSSEEKFNKAWGSVQENGHIVQYELAHLLTTTQTLGQRTRREDDEEAKDKRPSSICKATYKRR